MKLDLIIKTTFLGPFGKALTHLSRMWAGSEVLGGDALGTKRKTRCQPLADAWIPGFQ